MSEDVSDDSWTAAERELHLLAVLDRFAGEAEAGAEPRLATYLERYPQFTAELVELASGYAPRGGRRSETAGETGRETNEVTGAKAESARVPEGELSAGSRRALALLFVDAPGRGEGGEGGEGGEYGAPGSTTLRAVAEERAEYEAGGGVPTPGGEKGGDER